MISSGFTKAIGASPDDLNLAVSLFFVMFVLFQPISTAIGRQIGAKHWIPILMVSSYHFNSIHASSLVDLGFE